MHDTDYLGPAPAGTTWVLAHTTHPHSTDEPYTYIESFADVRTAVHELAERVRPRWTRQRSRITAEEITAEEVSTSLPAQAPANDWATVALYFEPDPRYRDGETFDLFRVDIDTAYTEAPPGAAEHVLVLPSRDLVCICGNMPHTTGFPSCDPYGNELTDGSWTGHLLCPDCGRVIDAATGRVTARLAGCKNCGEPVVHAAHPINDGETAWQHVTGEGRYLACPGPGGTVADPFLTARQRDAREGANPA